MSASIPTLPPQPPPPPAWRDRSRALVGYGWLLIVCGALCLLFVLLTSALVLLAPATSAAPAGATQMQPAEPAQTAPVQQPDTTTRVQP